MSLDATIWCVRDAAFVNAALPLMATLDSDLGFCFQAPRYCYRTVIFRASFRTNSILYCP